MPSSVSIPNGVFQVGTQTFGPAVLSDADSLVMVTLDRTAAQGLNSKPVTTTVNVMFELLMPGDPVWHYQGETTFQGGIRVDGDTGQQLNTDVLQVTLWQPGLAGRQARVTTTVAGSNVRLSGTLTTS